MYKYKRELGKENSMDNQRRRLHDNLYLPEGGLLGTEQNIMYLSSIRMLERAMRRGVILEAVVKVCDCTDMTLHVIWASPTA